MLACRSFLPIHADVYITFKLRRHLISRCLLHAFRAEVAECQATAVAGV